MPSIVEAIVIGAGHTGLAASFRRDERGRVPASVPTLRLAFELTIAFALLVSGCASTRTIGNDFRVTNRSDFFEFRIGSAENFTMAQTYSWWNPDSSATVRQTSEIRGGVARLEIRDVNGLVVHEKNLREQGTLVTSAGAPGMWSVEVTMDKATGSVRFQVEGR